MSQDAAPPHLFHVRRGSGEPLLLIMGMSGHHRMWGEPFLRLLENHFDILRFDHRGIGTSDPAGAPFTVVDMAEDAVRVLDEVGWDRAHVFGISLGGMVAQELALRHPDRVSTLSLGCTFGGVGGDLSGTGLQKYVEAGQSGDEALALRVGFDVIVSPAYAADPVNFETFTTEALAVQVPIPVVMLQLQAAMGHDALDRLPDLAMPTLVMHGTEDEMLVVANGKQVAEAIPGSRLEIFDGAGHMFWWEDPERAVSLLREHATQA